MSNYIKRMRIFAGPNGSGKSTIIQDIKSSYYTGFYLNADEIEKAFREKGFINLGDYHLQIKPPEFNKFLTESTLQSKAKSEGFEIALTLDNNIVKTGKSTHSYEAALLSEFLRLQLIKQEYTFSFETVMSHPSKLEILDQALQAGYKNYLYFIATESPYINIDRVSARVQKGGHNVPKVKIIERYYRSLELLSKVIPYTRRTYLFDNSGLNYKLIAELENGANMQIRDENVPNWVYSYVIEKMGLNQ